MKKLSAKQEKSDTWVVSSSIKNLLRVYNWKGQPMRIGSTMDDCDPRLKLVVVFDVYCININQLYTLTLQVPISSSTFWYVYTQKKVLFAIMWWVNWICPSAPQFHGYSVKMFNPFQHLRMFIFDQSIQYISLFNGLV